MDLFSQTTKYLNIIHNDKPFSGSINEVFSPALFEEINLITYVSSPSFFFQKLKPFKKVIAIFGEEEAASEFYQINPFIEELF